MENSHKRRRRLLALAIFLLVFFGGIVAFVGWAEDAYQPGATAVAALRSDTEVTVTTGEWTTFEPAAFSPTTGLIFYPGGRVEADAYAPLLRDIAAAGYLVVNVPMPLNLAILGGDRADDIRAAYPEIDRWVLAGHSLGGVMAAAYAGDHLDEVAGLILYAGYPRESDNLARSSLPVLTVYGSQDRVLENLPAATAVLPPDAQTVVLEGGNHAQFGDYGPQAGDGVATISAAEQRRQVLQATLAFLARLPGR